MERFVCCFERIEMNYSKNMRNRKKSPIAVKKVLIQSENHFFWSENAVFPLLYQDLGQHLRTFALFYHKRHNSEL